MKFLLVPGIVLLSFRCGLSQQTALKEEFCNNLNEVLERGRRDDFESLKMAMLKIVPMMETHQPNLKLPGFPKLAIDKDDRFVAETLASADSFGAIKKLDELKPYVSSCLDSNKWYWQERYGDDSTTAFFKEFKEIYASDGVVTITLAMVLVGDNVYSDNMYIRKNRLAPRR